MKINLRSIAPPKPLYLCWTLCVCLFSSTSMIAQIIPGPPAGCVIKLRIIAPDCSGTPGRNTYGNYSLSSTTPAGTAGFFTNGDAAPATSSFLYMSTQDQLKRMTLTTTMDYYGGYDDQGQELDNCTNTCVASGDFSDNGSGFVVLSADWCRTCVSCNGPTISVVVFPVIRIQNDDRTDAANNVYCQSDKVNLSVSYHGLNKPNVSWQYRIGTTGTFRPLVLPGSPAGVVSHSISFSLEDMFGTDAAKYVNQPICFRAAGDNSTPNSYVLYEEDEGSNYFTYWFSPSAPSVTAVEPALPLCAGDISKSMVLHFDRPLNPDEIITAITIKKGENILDQYQTPVTALDATNSFTWNDIKGMLPASGVYTVLIEGKLRDTATCNVKQFAFDVKDVTPVSFTGTQTNITCFGAGNGSITLTGNGGTGTYTFSKDNGASWQSSHTFSGLAPGPYTMLVKDNNDCQALASQTFTITGPAQVLTAAIDSYTDPKGADTKDGTVKVTVSGGMAPYTYSWNNGATTQNISGLGGGNYILTVTDKNNCTATAAVTLVAPSAIQLSFSEVSISCYGDADGAITASVSGGLKPYTYKWSNNATSATISNLAANTYTLTVTDANGIPTTAQYELKAPAVLTVTTTPVLTTCNGFADGKITSIVTGGTSPYTYTWNTGAKTADLLLVPAGTYTLTISDAHYCPAKATATVSSPAVLTVSGTVKNPSRNGAADGEITLSVNGGTTPYTYAWSNGGNGKNLPEGSYSVNITDANNCTATATFNVVQPAVLTGHIEVSKHISCHGLANGILTALAEGGTAPYTYAWSDGSTDTSIQQLPPGYYSVTITDQSGAFITDNYILTEPPALSLSLQASDVSCGGESNGTITSTVAGGLTPYTYAWSNGATTANLTGINSGMYTLHVTDANACILSSSATVTAPGALSATGIETDPLCYGNDNGSIDLTVTGGRVPYTYKWNTGAITEDLQNLSVGEYGVIITDNSGCIIKKGFALKNPPELSVDLGPTRTLCAGQSVDVNAGISNAASYQWTSDNGFTASLPNVTLSDAGTYTLTIKDAAGCTASGTIRIVKDDQPIAADFLMSTQCYTGESIIAVNVSQPAADRISWNLPSAASVISSTDAMVEMSFDKAGTYNVYMTAYKADCELTTVKDLIVVDGVDLPAVNTNHTSLIERAVVKPNPNNGQFVLEIQADEDITVNYRLLDIQRNLVVYERKGTLSKEIVTDEQFNIGNLMPGVYVLLVETAKEKKALKVLIL